jgi:hypothetical protein
MTTRAQLSLQRGRVRLHAHFPTHATYLPPGAGATAVDCTALIDAQLDEQVMAEIGREYRRTAKACLMAAEIPSPAYQGTLTIASGSYAGTWIIRRVIPLSGGDHEVMLGADAIAQLAAPQAGWTGPLQ